MGTIFLDSIYMCQYMIFIFPDSSSGKESTCIAEEASLIPGLGRSTGEGIGYPLQYFWASLVAPKSLQMVTAAMKLKDAYSLEAKL